MRSQIVLIESRERMLIRESLFIIIPLLVAKIMLQDSSIRFNCTAVSTRYERGDPRTNEKSYIYKTYCLSLLAPKYNTFGIVTLD